MLEDNSNPFMQLLQEASGGSTYQQALASNVQRLQEAGAASEAATSAQVEASNIANKQKLEGEFAAQEEGRKTKAMMGGDAADPNYLIGLLTQDFQANTRAALSERKQIEAMDATSIIDSPLQWLVNQFTVNDVIDRHNFHAQAADESANTINQISIVTSNAAQMAKTTAQVVTRESMAAQLEAQTRAGLAAISQLKQQNLMHETNAIQAIQQGKIQETQQYYAAENHRMQLEEFARSGERFEWEKAAAEEMSTMRKLQLDMHMEEWNAKQDEKARILADKTATTTTFQVGARAIGFNGDVSEGTMKQMLANPDLKKVADRILSAGIEKLSTGRTVIAPTPGEAVTTLRQAGTVGNWATTNAQPVLKYLDGLVNKAKSSPEFAGAKTVADQDAYVEAYINKAHQSDVAGWMKNAEAPTSLYLAPDLLTMEVGAPQIKNTALYNLVLRPLVEATNNSDMNFAKVDGAVRAAIKTGKLTANQAAAEVAEFYKTAAVVNNAHKQFTSFRLPAQTSYNIQLGDTLLGSGASYTFDVSRPEQYLKYLQYKQFVEARTVNSTYYDGLKDIMNMVSGVIK